MLPSRAVKFEGKTAVLRIQGGDVFLIWDGGLASKPVDVTGLAAATKYLQSLKALWERSDLDGWSITERK